MYVRSTLILLALLAAAVPLRGQDDAAGPQLSDDELESLVAPVALYPDILLSQVLEACQDPSSIVKASDLLTSDEDDVKPDPKWPGSVKVLLHVPIVMQMLDEHLAWATRLGHAQKSNARGVVSAVHRVRAKTQAAGNLDLGDKVVVTGEAAALKIELADPGTLNVPMYDAMQLYSAHAADCPEWFAWADPITFPGYKSVELAFHSEEFVRQPYHHHHYDGPATGSTHTVVTTVSVGYNRGGGLFRNGHINWGWGGHHGGHHHH